MSRGDIHDAIAFIYDAALDPAAWPAALDRCTRLLGSHCGLIAGQSLARPEGHAVVHGFDPAALDAYFSHYADCNVFAPRALAVSEGTIETDQDVMARADFVRTEFYNDFLVARLDAHHVLTTLLFRDSESAVMFTVCRGRNNADAAFGRHDREVLAQLAPHLKRAHQIASSLHRQQAVAARLGDLLDRSTRGVLVVSATGRVVYANRLAESVLQGSDALSTGAYGLRAATAKVSDRLAALVGDAAAGGEGGAIALPSQRGGDSVHALVTPYGADRAWLGVSEPCALILLRPGDHRPPLLPEHARAIFGLSRTEALVASELHHGLDLGAIADVLGISRHTARVHLNAILAKTGTHRQATLIQRLASVAELHGATGAMPVRPTGRSA